MATAKENSWSVPNALSAYRILALPFIIHSIVTGDKQLFITLLSVNLITDILDGLIARVFRLQTELGAKLDSLADIGTYLMALSVLRFGRFPSFHLWSNKATGYIQGIFIFTFFLFGFWKPYFYCMLVFSYLAYLEEFVLVLILPELRSNLKSIFFVWRRNV